MEEGQAPAQPVHAAEADALLDMLAGESLLLAVSGGPDSVALMGLSAQWARRHGHRLPAVAVVDHGLRVESGAEAEHAAVLAAGFGLDAAILRWSGPKPSRGLPAAARQARYGLLTAQARALGATAIVTAHTLDDQAETVMMRLAAGSGLAGMAGMRPEAITLGVRHLRPLLTVPKIRLIATCRHHGWAHSHDPSNRDPRFARPRWRAILPLLEREGLDAARLSAFAERCADAEDALQAMAKAALAACLLPATGKLWRIDAEKLGHEPRAVRSRVLARLVAGGEENASLGPRLGRIEACADALAAAAAVQTELTRTLGGLVLSLDRRGVLSATVQPPRNRGCVNPVRSPSLGKGPAEA